MTDTEMQRRKAICDVAGVDDIGKLSDGFHTFDSLYEQRMILFAALVKAYKNKAWKSYRHEDGEYCFGGGWFIVGIDTPEGSYTYHYENKYWDMFDCIDLPRGKHWDGHTEADAETRLMSLEPERTETHGDVIYRQDAIDAINDLRDCENGYSDTYDKACIIGVLEEQLSARPEPIRINLNEPIKVKLTNWGKEIYYHQYDRTNQIAGREICKPRFPREDENGYAEFQLWCFMELYGEYMGMTLPNVIEPLEIVYER